MKRVLIIVIAAILAAGCAQAVRHKGTRKTPRKAATEAVTTTAIDTIVPAEGDFILSGYEKRLTSNVETNFITNRSDQDIVGFELITEYYDMQQRLLHKMTRRIRAIVPAGESRRVDYSSWDKQKIFYYHKDRRHRAEAVPYDVRQSITRVFISRD